MKSIRWLVVVLGALAVALVGAAQLGLLGGSAPPDLGVTKGRLEPPSSTPNSVSSQSNLYPGHPQQAYAAIEPLKFSGDGEAAMVRLASLLTRLPGTVVVVQRSDYLYAQSSTRLLKFTDDVEFLLDKSAGAIQVRSASRLGRKDFGVNRARIEDIRARFQG